MSFQQGLSGLNASSRALDATGNNIANVSTVGFKSATPQFADVYAAALSGGSSGGQIGIGATLAAVSQNFTQGNLTSTNNPLDIAINGNGFLHFQPSLTDKTASYTRNGQLHLNSEGYIVNPAEQYLCCFPSPDGTTIDQTSPAPLQVSSGSIEPKQTGWTDILSPGTGGLTVGINLDVRDKKAATATLVTTPTPATGWSAMPDWDFTALNPTMYNYSTSVNVYDQSGESHVLTMYFVRQSDGGAAQRDWMPHYVLDSKYEIPATTDSAATTPATALRFLANGQIDTASASAFYLDFANAKDSTGATIVLNDTTDTPPGLAMFDPLIPVQVDFALATQFGAAYDVNRLEQDGYGPGRLAGISIDKEGMVLGRYSNGQAKLMGQITLTTFQNPNGLVSLGGNMWAPSSGSGQALEGSPNAGSRGLIQSASVEDSNVDLTQELVQLITQQRAYQANAQTIKTQDSVLQTLVNLR